MPKRYKNTSNEVARHQIFPHHLPVRTQTMCSAGSASDALHQQWLRGTFLSARTQQTGLRLPRQGPCRQVEGVLTPGILLLQQGEFIGRMYSYLNTNIASDVYSGTMMVGRGGGVDIKKQWGNKEPGCSNRSLHLVFLLLLLKFLSSFSPNYVDKQV